MRDRLIFAVKLGLSIFIVFLMGRRMDMQQLALTVQHADLRYLGLSIAMAMLAVPAVSMRWAVVARVFAIQLPNRTAMEATFAGLFVGQVLPGAIGADVVRGWMIWHLGMRKKMIVASLVADRLISLTAVGLRILIGLPFLARSIPQHEHLLVSMSLVGLTLFLVAILAFDRIIKHAKSRDALTLFQKRFSTKNISISTQKTLVLLLLAVLGHVFFILSAYYIGLAMNINSSLWTWCIIIPIVSLASAIPISINGWGVREFAMIELWSIFGMTKSDAFLSSISMGIVAIISSLPGVYYWLTKKGSESQTALDSHKD